MHAIIIFRLIIYSSWQFLLLSSKNLSRVLTLNVRICPGPHYNIKSEAGLFLASPVNLWHIDFLFFYNWTVHSQETLDSSRCLYTCSAICYDFSIQEYIFSKRLSSKPMLSHQRRMSTYKKVTFRFKQAPCLTFCLRKAHFWNNQGASRGNVNTIIKTMTLKNVWGKKQDKQWKRLVYSSWSITYFLMWWRQKSL